MCGGFGVGTGSHPARGVWGPAGPQDSAPIPVQTEGNGSHPKDNDDCALHAAACYVQMCRPQADFYCEDGHHKPYLEASLLPMLLMWG